MSLSDGFTTSGRLATLRANPAPRIEGLEPRLLLAADVVFSESLLAGGANLHDQTIVFENDQVVNGDLVLDGVRDVVFKGHVSVAGNVVIHATDAVSFDLNAALQAAAGKSVSVSAPVVTASGLISTVGGSVSLVSTVATVVTSAGVIDVGGVGGSSGGSIRLWSDSSTVAAGSLLAGGGSLGGDGGLVEVSSAGGLSLTGRVDTKAPAGQSGMLLLDPKNVTIGGLDDGYAATDFDQFTDLPAASVNLSVANLLSWGDVTILANNDITVNSAINMGVGDSLTLRAGRSVLINAGITTNNEALSITANDAGADLANRDAGAGAITMAAGTSIDTGSGTITLTISTLSTAGAITVDSVATTGTATLSSAGSIVESDSDAAADLAAGTLNLTVTTSGALIGAEGNPLEINATTLNAQTNDGNIVLEDTAGGVTLGTVDAGTADLILTATGGSIAAAAGPGRNITAGLINLTTTGAGVAIGTSGAPIRTEIGILNATTEDGGIYFDELDGVIVTSVVSRQMVGGDAKTAFSKNGTVVLDSDGTVGTFDVSILAGDDVVVGEVTAPDAATVSSTGGALVDLNEATNNVIARTLTLAANDDIGQSADPLETTVETVSATSTTGSAYLSELDALTIGAIVAANDVSVSVPNGSVAVGTVTAPGTLTLKAEAGAITDNNGAAGNISGGTANLTARTGIGSSSDPLETDVADLSATVTGSAAPVYLNEANALSSLAVTTKDGDTTVNFTGGPLTFVASSDELNAPAAVGTAITFQNTNGDVAVVAVNAGGAAVTLSASGAIRDNVNDAVVDLTGGTVTLTAGTAIGAAGNELDTSVDDLTATASAGGVYIREATAITLSATATGAGNDVDVANAAGNMTLNGASAPDAVILGTGGSMLDGNGASANVTGSSATLTAGAAIGTAGDAIETAVSTLSAVASGGGLFVSSSQALIATTATATGGALTLSASGNLTLGQVTAAGQTATLTSSAAILDGNGVGTNNITAGTAVLSGTRIGTSGDAIDTTVGTLRANTTAGGIYILDTNSLTVDSVTALGSGSDVEIETNGGDMALGSVTAAGDEVVLAASGAITDANGGAVNVTARKLTITAPGGIGVGDSLELDVNELDANGGGGGGGMINAGALALAESSFEGKGAATLTYQAESITVLDIADNVASVGADGSVVLRTSTGNIVFLDLNDTIQTSGTGTITIEAGTTAGSKAVAIVGNLTTQDHNINVSAAGSVTIGQLNAGAGDVAVTSTSGVIVDGNGPAVNIIADTATLTATTPTARHAELTTIRAIADASALRSEAAAKQTSADSFSSAATISAAAKAAAGETLATAENDVTEKQSAKDDADAAVEPVADAVLALTIVSEALDIANTIAGTVAAVAQAVPFTGDGGSATAAFVITIIKNATDVALIVLNMELDALSGTASDAATALAKSEAQEYAADQTYTLATSTADAFQEASSIATAAADKAAIASDAAAVVETWAVVAEDQGNAIGAEDDPLFVQAGRVDASVTKGGIYLTTDENIALGDVATTDPAGQIVVQGNGDIIVAGIISSPMLLSLDAGNRILDGGGQAVAADFLAQAATYIGTSADPIETDVDRLAADGGAGGVFMNNSGALAITEIEGVDGVTGAADVSLTVTGSMTLEQPVSAPGQTVTLTATGGAIIDAHSGSEDVSALTLLASAAGGISLDTVVTNLTATATAAGSIAIRETDGVTLTSVQSANGPITVTAGNDITATSVVSTTDNDANDIALTSLGGGIAVGTVNAGAANGDVTLDSHATITMLGGGRVTADVLTADSVNGQTLTTTVNSANLSVSGIGGIDVTELNGITLTDVDTANGAITVTAGGTLDAVDVQSLTDADANDISLTASVGDILIGTVNAGELNGDVTLNAAGTISTAPGGRVTGDVLTADAGGGMTLTTTANSANLSVSGPGSINVTELDAITLTDVDTANGAITVTAGGTILADDVQSLTDADANDIHLDAVGGSIQAGVVNAGTAAGDVTLDSDGAISMALGGRVTADVLTADSLNGQTLTTTVNTADLSVADVGDIDVTELDGITLLALDTAEGSIGVTAGGDIAVGDVNAAAGEDDVTLAAAAAITEFAPDGLADITANNLTMTAGTGIGTTLEPIEIAVTALEAAGGTGGVHLVDLIGGLVIGGTSGALTGVSATGGDIGITAMSPLTVDEPVTNTGGGNVSLTAAGTDGDDDLLINANVSASGAGNVTLDGADDILQAASASISAGGLLTITADQPND
ncbi:MAG: LEPR-XLL domain-containing protein, partial [Phycisphaerae bacterium]|nr:LEPR-XLL domain-containing protein [Phycisphaerae bacterium]